MRKQLEIKALIMWVVFMCIFWMGVSNATDLEPKMSDEQLKCIIMGGKWIDNMCVKSAKSDPLIPKCDPFVCLMTWNGKCINDECVKQEFDTGSMLSPSNKIKPKH
jgi:hypothetical protein